MDFFQVPESPEYSREIRKFKITDPAHADVFNHVIQALINNNIFVKNLVERLSERLINVDNTHDMDKPVSSAMLDALSQKHAQLTDYTDKAVSSLNTALTKNISDINDQISALNTSGAFKGRGILSGNVDIDSIYGPESNGIYWVIGQQDSINKYYFLVVFSNVESGVQMAFGYPAGMKYRIRINGGWLSWNEVS